MERPKLLTIDRPIEYLLSGISSTSAIITRFIRSVRVAHADLAAVTRDLSDLRLILELLRDEPGVPLVLQGQMLLVLESCGNILIHIDNILARCPDPAKWIESGRNETASCRSSLAVFREALYSSTPYFYRCNPMSLTWRVYSAALQDHPADADAVKDNIQAEVNRLLENTRSMQQGADKAEPARLSTYLEVVSSCAQHSGYPGREEEAETKTTYESC
jgi:hypothetical protein